MPVHDWTRVFPGAFHDFHHEWIAALKHALNRGVLPSDYYAAVDQDAGPGNPDVIGLQRVRRGQPPKPPTGNGTVVLATATPPVRFRDRATGGRRPVRRPKRVAVRHKSGDRVVALVEVVSAGNKSGVSAIRSFAWKLTAFIEDGIHLLVLDLFPPGPRDQQGIHPVIWSPFHKNAAFELPADKRLTLAAYAAGPDPEAFVEPVGVGDVLPDMPLFLTPDDYVNVPLEATYRAAWAEVPDVWREVLEQTGP